MRKLIKNTTSLFLEIFSGIREVIKLPFNTSYYSGDCYFPEYYNLRKNVLRVFLDQLLHTIKYGRPNAYYFPYGFDIKNFRKTEEYVDYSLFMRRRRIMNDKTNFSPIVVLRDKSLFGIVADAYGISTPFNYGIIESSRLYLFAEKKNYDINSWMNGKTIDAFMKKIDGECADGVYHIQVGKDGVKNRLDMAKITKSGRWLLQSAITNQHKCISALHPKSINTIRLVTVWNNRTNEVEILSGVLRIGKGDNEVDNWAVGGISVGINIENSTLREYGYYKPGFGTKIVKHPDSQIVFKDYPIPYLKAAIEDAKIFHRHLSGIHSIGWDIAITEDGPCFVEGNDNWEISLLQVVNYGLKKEFDRLFY